MTFGTSSLVDLLSWMIAFLLGLKVVATMILLRRDKRRWFDHRWSVTLWWSTKIAPLLAVPCMITVALLRHDIHDAWAYAALMLFVTIAVPLIVWRRFYRRPVSVT